MTIKEWEKFAIIYLIILLIVISLYFVSSMDHNNSDLLYRSFVIGQAEAFTITSQYGYGDKITDYKWIDYCDKDNHYIGYSIVIKKEISLTTVSTKNYIRDTIDMPNKQEYYNDIINLEYRMQSDKTKKFILDKLSDERIIETVFSLINNTENKIVKKNGRILLTSQLDIK